MLTKNCFECQEVHKVSAIFGDFVTGEYSRPTVTLLDDNSVLALKDEKDIKIAAVL